jgi:hypothetical protein
MSKRLSHVRRRFACIWRSKALESFFHQCEDLGGAGKEAV